MPDAPITTPGPGQSMRSLSSVVSVTRTSPQLTWLASAGAVSAQLAASTAAVHAMTLERAKLGRADAVRRDCTRSTLQAPAAECHRSAGPGRLDLVGLDL